MVFFQYVSNLLVIPCYTTFISNKQGISMKIKLDDEFKVITLRFDKTWDLYFYNCIDRIDCLEFKIGPFYFCYDW